MAREPKGYVYFVLCRAMSVVKIGWTTHHPDVRLGQLQTASPAPLERHGIIRGVKSIESELHTRFARLRVRTPGEWFRIDEELATYIRQHASEWHLKGTPVDVPSEAAGENYGDTVNGLAMEFLRLHVPNWSPYAGATFPAVKFFEFCRERGVKLRRSDRTYLKMTGKGLVRASYKYKGRPPRPARVDVIKATG